ncbi:MAG: DNA repair protein RadC [Candidatus Thiodiazotropha endolucinida]
MKRKQSPFKKNRKNRTYTALRDLTCEDIISTARSLISERYRRTDHLENPATTKAYVILQLGELEQEVFSCLFLDNRHRIIAFEKLFFGTINGATVHPREVVKKALSFNAAAVIFAHNHPSGHAEPSRADEVITKRLTDALSLVDVRVLDHIVVGANGATSFAEQGLL